MVNETLRIISVDGGNKDIKAVMGSLEGMIRFPNILCPLPDERQNLENDYSSEKKEDKLTTQLKNLHFKVKSPSLSTEFNEKVFGAGELAMKNKKGRMEVPERTVKATNDQILVMYLLVAAIDAINTKNKDWTNTIHYQAVLSAFLPIVDLKSKKNYKEKFLSRLKGKHEIQFLQMPGFEETRIFITFTEIYVSPEGVAAVIDLAIAEQTNLHIADTSLMSKKVLVNEIGGGTTEQPIVNKGGVPDKDESGGLRIGTSSYLDEIMKEISVVHESYEVSSREKLIEYMQDIDHPYQIKVDGVPRGFKDIAERHLGSCAKRIFDEIDYKWKNVDDLEVALNIGGGSILLKPYLEKANNKKYPFQFVSDEKLVPFLNARGGWKIAQRKEEKKRLTVK